MYKILYIQHTQFHIFNMHTFSFYVHLIYTIFQIERCYIHNIFTIFSQQIIDGYLLLIQICSNNNNQ